MEYVSTHSLSSQWLLFLCDLFVFIETNCETLDHDTFEYLFTITNTCIEVTRNSPILNEQTKSSFLFLVLKFAKSNLTQDDILVRKMNTLLCTDFMLEELWPCLMESESEDVQMNTLAIIFSLLSGPSCYVFVGQLKSHSSKFIDSIISVMLSNSLTVQIASSKLILLSCQISTELTNIFLQSDIVDFVFESMSKSNSNTLSECLMSVITLLLEATGECDLLFLKLFNSTSIDKIAKCFNNSQEEGRTTLLEIILGLLRTGLEASNKKELNNSKENLYQRILETCLPFCRYLAHTMLLGFNGTIAKCLISLCFILRTATTITETNRTLCIDLSPIFSDLISRLGMEYVSPVLTEVLGEFMATFCKYDHFSDVLETVDTSFTKFDMTCILYDSPRFYYNYFFYIISRMKIGSTLMSWLSQKVDFFSCMFRIQAIYEQDIELNHVLKECMIQFLVVTEILGTDSEYMTCIHNDSVQPEYLILYITDGQSNKKIELATAILYHCFYNGEIFGNITQISEGLTKIFESKEALSLLNPITKLRLVELFTSAEVYIQSNNIFCKLKSTLYTIKKVMDWYVEGLTYSTCRVDLNKAKNITKWICFQEDRNVIQAFISCLIDIPKLSTLQVIDLIRETSIDILDMLLNVFSGRDLNNDNSLKFIRLILEWSSIETLSTKDILIVLHSIIEPSLRACYLMLKKGDNAEPLTVETCCLLYKLIMRNGILDGNTFETCFSYISKILANFLNKGLSQNKKSITTCINILVVLLHMKNETFEPKSLPIDCSKLMDFLISIIQYLSMHTCVENENSSFLCSLIQMQIMIFRTVIVQNQPFDFLPHYSLLVKTLRQKSPLLQTLSTISFHEGIRLVQPKDRSMYWQYDLVYHFLSNMISVSVIQYQLTTVGY